MGGFDTHTNSKGQLHDHATEVNGALNAFFMDLGTTLRPFVSIMTCTEFGRTFGENGGQGTDHGHAQGVMVLGGGATEPFAPAGDDGDLALETQVHFNPNSSAKRSALRWNSLSSTSSA